MNHLRYRRWEDDAHCRPGAVWAVLPMAEHRTICGGCPVRTDCLTLAYDYIAHAGASLRPSDVARDIWAGHTLAELMTGQPDLPTGEPTL